MLRAVDPGVPFEPGGTIPILWDAPYMNLNRCFALIANSLPNARAPDVMNVVMVGEGPAAVRRR